MTKEIERWSAGPCVDCFAPIKGMLYVAISVLSIRPMVTVSTPGEFRCGGCQAIHRARYEAILAADRKRRLFGIIPRA